MSMEYWVIGGMIGAIISYQMTIVVNTTSALAVGDVGAIVAAGIGAVIGTGAWLASPLPNRSVMMG